MSIGGAWRVLDASGLQGSLASRRGHLHVKPDDENRPSTAVPAVDIAVVLIGPHVRLSSAALHRIHDAGGIALYTDWRGIPRAGSYSWTTHNRVGARANAQISMSLPRRKNAWGRIVRAKILGQAHVLAEAGARPAAKQLRGLSTQVRSGDPANREAQAARTYWQHLTLEQDFRRAPRAALDDTDPNALLDYGYGVLRGHAIRAVLAAGLLPAIGLHHHNRANAFNLADDLIEPFRPTVDHYVKAHPGGSLEDQEVRHALVAAATQAFTPDGVTIPTCLQTLAQHVGQLAEGHLDRLDVPTWQGPHREP